MKGRLLIALLLLGGSVGIARAEPATAEVATEAEAATGEPESDPWAPIRPLLGRWEGSEIGKEDASHIERGYEVILDGKFIRSSTLAIFELSEPDSGTEVHEDIGIFSFDSDRGVLVLREFMSEGYVITYVLERATADSLVLVSESAEGAGGFGARLTYSLLGPDEHVEQLDLAPPGKDYFTCHRMKMARSAD